MDRIYLDGTVTFVDQDLATVRTALNDHIALTCAEPGCVRFDVSEDPDQAGRFIVSECFIDQASFDAHQERAGASPWAEASKGGKRDYVIRKGEGEDKGAWTTDY